MEMLTGSVTKIDARLLKQQSRMDEASISLKDVLEELTMDQRTVKRLLKLLDQSSTI